MYFPPNLKIWLKPWAVECSFVSKEGLKIKFHREQNVDV